MPEPEQQSEWTVAKSSDPAGDVGASAAMRLMAEQAPGPGEKYPGGLPPELYEAGSFPTTRKELEQGLPTAAALIGTQLLPQARITKAVLPLLGRMGITTPMLQKILLGMGRVSEAAAIGGVAQAGIEGERQLTGSQDRSKTVGEFFSSVGGQAAKQAGYQTVGEVVGLPLAKGGERLLSEEEVASKLLNRSVTRRDLFEWGRAIGVHLTPAEAAGGGLAELAQHLAETSILGISAAKESWLKSHKAIQDLITEIRTILGAGGLTNQEVGKLLKTNLNAVIESIEGPNGFFDKAYTDFGTRANVKVNIGQAKLNIKKYYNDLGDVMKAQPALTEEIAPALKRGKEFIGGKDELDPLLAHRIRSKFWALARTTENPEVRRIVALMGKEMDTAIVQAAEAAEPRLGKAWRGINWLYRDWNKTLGEASVSTIRKAKAEDIGKFLYNAGQTPTHALQKIFTTWGNDQESIQAMRDGFFNQFFKDADALGIVAERKIMATLLKVGPERLNMVLGRDPTGVQAFNNLVMIGRAEAMTPRLLNPSFTAVGIRAHWGLRMILEGTLFGLGVGGGLATGRSMEAAGMMGLATLGVEGVLSKVIFSRGATNALIKAMSGAATGNTQVYISNLARMYEMIQDTREAGRMAGDFVRKTLAGKPTPTPTVLSKPELTPTPAPTAGTTNLTTDASGNVMPVPTPVPAAAAGGWTVR